MVVVNTFCRVFLIVLSTLLLRSTNLISQEAESFGFQKDKKSGSGFYEAMRLLEFEERESLIVSEILSGNLPPFILDFVEITTSQRDAQEGTHKVTLFVSPDYLSVGDSCDYFITPMGPLSAQIIADRYSASLPTPK